MPLHRCTCISRMLWQNRRPVSTAATAGASATLTVKQTRYAVEDIPNAKSISVAVVGAPNSGKSTLTNALSGTKVSSVSSKYNTTRGRVLGVFRVGQTEVVLTDTPGFVDRNDAAGRRYEHELVNAARLSVPSADVALLIVDVARRWDEEQQVSYASVLRLALDNGCLPIIVANKADLLKGLKLDNTQQGIATAIQQAAAKRTSYSHDFSPRFPQIRDVLGLKTAILRNWMEDQMIAASVLSHAASGPRDASDQPLPRTARGGIGQRPLLMHEGLERPWGLFGQYMSLKRPLAEAEVIDIAPQGQSGRQGARAARSGRDDDIDDLEPGSADTHVQDRMQLPNIYLAAGVPPVIPVSAVRGLESAGVDNVRSALLKLALPRPWVYSSTQGATDASALDLVTLCVREPLFEALHGDVPYKIHLAVRAWSVRGEGKGTAATDTVSPTAAVHDGNGATFARDDLDDEMDADSGALRLRSGAAAPTGTAVGASSTSGRATSSTGPSRVLAISMDVRVPSRAVAGMLLGRGGSPIRTVAKQATASLQRMVDAASTGAYPSLQPYAGPPGQPGAGCRVRLDLHVAVKEGITARAQAGKTRDGSVGQAAALE